MIYNLIYMQCTFPLNNSICLLNKYSCLHRISSIVLRSFPHVHSSPLHFYDYHNRAFLYERHSFVKFLYIETQQHGI